MHITETLVESAHEQHIEGIRNEVGCIENTAVESLNIDGSVRGNRRILGEPEYAVSELLDDQERPLHQLVHKHCGDGRRVGCRVASS